MKTSNGLKIAIGGKGGVGKTTVCAVWSKLFADEEYDVLAIDADPNTNLASAFGIPADQTAEPLIKMKKLIAERTGTDKDSVGAYFRLNPAVSDLPEKYWRKIDGVKLLVLGGIAQAGAGCACPEEAFMKAFLAYTILQRKEIILVDLAAGVEFMGRATIAGIDALTVVVEPGGRSIETANNIAKMAQQLGIKHIAAVLNKITADTHLETVKSRLTIPVLASINYNPLVQQADLHNKAVFEIGGELVKGLQDAKENLTKLIRS
jgi:CO dehydrogenase maturation factor